MLNSNGSIALSFSVPNRKLSVFKVFYLRSEVKLGSGHYILVRNTGG